ncbi:hypothetical protein [Actibacterium sp. MT2.3-13A]|uniref:hypothetical protein n=1 Tax=Actibacterium sp. MT2.3-13A TaxID=2828332 RepID=UPI001BABEC8C|nr:hypothetical protein [Actibacterium sp. MT2.3-13A]
MAGPDGTSANAPGGGGAARLAEALALGALLVALWLSVRPYQGIAHDARLYMAQALHRLGRAGLEGDLFFQYGSQDSFSAFSPVFAPAVALWGPATAHLVFAVIGQAVWLAALWALARSLFGRGWLGLASMGVAIAMVPNYGWGVLSYGERFVTPRLLAEAITLLALAAALRGRRGAAGGLVCAAGLLHPLMALPGLAAILALTLPRNRWTVLGGAAALGAVAALAAAGVEPFGRALQVYDEAWLAIVRDRTPHAFVADWSWRGPVLGALPLLILSLNAASGPPRDARLARIVLLVSGGLVLLGWLGGEVLRNVLVMNLQLWRGLWILTLMGNLLAVRTVLRLPAAGRARPCLILAIAANVISAWTGLLPHASAAMGLAGLLALAVESGKGRALTRWERLAIDLVVAVSAVFLLVTVGVAAVRQGAAEGAAVAVLRPLIALGALGLLLGWRRVSAARPALVALLPLALAFAALGLADRRTAWTTYVETGAAPDPALAALVSGRTTYWEGGLELLWFKLGQPSFYSCTQGAGVMFYRATAFEYARRAGILRLLGMQEEGHCARPRPDGGAGPTSAEALASVCRALPELDLVVLSRPVAGLEGALWRAPAPWRPLEGRRGDGGADDDPYAFHLYSCADLRAPPR